MHAYRNHDRTTRPSDQRHGGSGGLHDALNGSATVQAQIALGDTLNHAVQRVRDEDEDERLTQMTREEEEDDRIAQMKADDSGLPDHVRAGAESLSGLSLEGVNVHYGSSRPAQLHALAYTQDTDIHVAPGQEQHVAHEAWHVVQQMQGRVRPTTSVSGVSVNDDSALEREADVMGARAASAGASVQEKREEG